MARIQSREAILGVMSLAKQLNTELSDTLQLKKVSNLRILALEFAWLHPDMSGYLIKANFFVEVKAIFTSYIET